MKPLTICFIVLGCQVFSFLPDLDAAPRIVEDGQPQAEIVIAENPARAAEFGVSELQTYIEKMTGARLAIVTTPTGRTRSPSTCP